MATFLEELEKEVQIDHLQTNTYPLVQIKTARIGPADNLSPFKNKKKLNV